MPSTWQSDILQIDIIYRSHGSNCDIPEYLAQGNTKALAGYVTELNKIEHTAHILFMS